MRSALILAACAALAAAGCGKYSPPVRLPAVTPDAGPVYDAGQPPETAEERRAERVLERERQRRPQSVLQPGVVPAAPPVEPPVYPVAPPPEPAAPAPDPAQTPTP